MKLRSKAVLAMVAAFALLATFSGAAHAAVPGFEPDPASLGTLSLYDAAGNPVTGGSLTDEPPFFYVKGSAAPPAGDTKATLFGAAADSGKVVGLWDQRALTPSTNYPNAAAPGSLSTAKPLVSLDADFGSVLNDLFLSLPSPGGTNTYSGIYQLRLVTSGPGGQSLGYQDAAIQITGTTWSLVYPVPVATATTTSLAASPASPQNAGTSVTLTATVSPAAAGTVEFKDGSNSLGTAPVTAGSATLSTSSLTVATHSLTAVFTPTSPAAFGPSTSAPVSYQITATPATPTSLALAVNTGTSTAFAPVILDATVTATPASPAPTGTVTFTEGASVLGSAPVSAGAASLTTSALGQGSHTITATFTATDPSKFSGSSATSQAFTLGAAQYAPDQQNIKATIGAGTLVITTPYTPTSPLDLGALTLDANGTQYSGSAPFTGISVTDTRAGNLAWTVSALAGNLSNGTTGTINGQNVGLTGLVADPIAGNSLTAASVTVTNNAAASPAVGATDPGAAGLGGSPHTVLHAANGLGSIGFHGVLTLNAPTSSPAGTYTGTVTFTIG